MTDTSALIEGHYLVTSYPAAWCQCHHTLAWETRAEDHAAHVISAIQAEAWEEGFLSGESETSGIELRDNPYHDTTQEQTT